MQKMAPLRTLTSPLPEKMKIPKAYETLMAEHAKASYTETPSWSMAEVFRINNDMVMSWYWSKHVQKFVNETDIDIKPIVVDELPFDQMFFEFERSGDFLPFGCFITKGPKDTNKLMFQPVVFAKWHSTVKPYWAYIAEGYEVRQPDLDALPSWLEIDYETKSLSVNYTDQDEDMGIHVYEWLSAGEIPQEMSQLSKHVMATVMHFLAKLLALLECSNTPVEVVKPSPLKVQMARKARKPTPRPYRILKLSASETREAFMMERAKGGSVRTHLRRGHIRNVRTARGHVRRWIKPCIVNAHKSDEIIKETVVT